MTKVKEYIEYISRGISPAYDDEGITVLNQKCIRNQTILFENARITNNIKKNISKEKYIKNYDVLINSTGVGTLGRVAQAKNIDTDITVDSHVTIVRPNLEKINGNFFGYCFKAQENMIESLGVGATGQTELSRDSILKNVEIPDYTFLQQEKISNIMLHYDDLIENNNKRIKILEEMAQKIYKEWFVDFKFPNHETATFKQTDLGEIPSDWEVVTVDTFCNIFTGKKNANAAISNGKYKFYTCAPEPLLIDTYIYDGRAVIIAGNGSYTGRTLFYDGKFDLYQRTYACTIKENYTDDYIYTLYAIIKNSLEKDISGGTHGAAVPYIVFDDIAKHQFAFNKRVFDKSSIIFKQIFNAILMFNKKNQTLKQTRDLLLPRLISGEIDVENMEIV